MTGDDVLRYLRERLPTFVPRGEPLQLPEGNLNLVWRVVGSDRSVIVKYAPPYIAATPEIPLDPSRFLIESRCLEIMSPGGRLEAVAGRHVRPPRPLDVNGEECVLVMEDVGEVPSFGRWLREAEGDVRKAEVQKRGRWLGQFIGRFHAETFDDSSFADAFDNRPMQETRHAVQYEGVADMLATAEVADAETLGARAAALGERLLEPGRCLTMGDLWPPSVLVVEGGLRLIDWELAHYGRPLQDVAHWLAHLWMHAHRAPSSRVANAIVETRTAFLEGYRQALGGAADGLWTAEERHEAAVHFGAEILVRTTGPFQDGYLYEGLSPEAPAIQEAVETAARHLRSPAVVNLLKP